MVIKNVSNMYNRNQDHTMSNNFWFMNGNQEYMGH